MWACRHSLAHSFELGGRVSVPGLRSACHSSAHTPPLLCHSFGRVSGGVKHRREDARWASETVPGRRHRDCLLPRNSNRCVLQMAKKQFPSGGHSRQKAWKNLTAGAELFHLRSFCHFSLSSWVNALSASLFVSITLSASLPPLPLTPSASFSLCSVVVQAFFCSFPSHLSLLSLSLSLSQYISLQFPLLPRLLLCFFPVFFPHLISLFFFILHPNKIYVCPPRPRWHVHTHMHRCTHPPLFFCPSYLDLYQPSSSGPLPVLLRGTQLSAEEKRRDAWCSYIHKHMHTLSYSHATWIVQTCM